MSKDANATTPRIATWRAAVLHTANTRLRVWQLGALPVLHAANARLRVWQLGALSALHTANARLRVWQLGTLRLCIAQMRVHAESHRRLTAAEP